MKNLLIVIPAIKKNAVIPDQLIKKLDGITLIQRAINTAKQLTTNENIFIITDSEEISLISERNQINYHYDNMLSLNSDNIIKTTNHIIKDINLDEILIYRANAPLVDFHILQDAYNVFLHNKDSILTSVREEKKKLLKKENNNLVNIEKDDYVEEIKAFLFYSKQGSNHHQIKPFIVENEKSIEIESYQDWWVCEKILQRKKIVFNVIGSLEIGMGHIYHSLALAHEITDHEIIFICDEKYKIAVDKIAATDYKVIAADNVTDTIISLDPDIVINDILNTDEAYIKLLKENNIIVVNFEDLGTGSKYADLVFNELYDVPQCKGDNYMWGYQYLALRDEFDEATPHAFLENIENVLISFGGTDQSNLTMTSLKAIVSICQSNDIKIYIVCGSGYIFKKELEEYIGSLEYKNIHLTYAIGVISKIMEKTQISLTSNGRTVYELADMNIPSIVISHHEREATHSFATLEKGFINLGIVNNRTPNNIQKTFLKLVEDQDYRKLLFMNIQKYCFRKNKQKVVNKILNLF